MHMIRHDYESVAMVVLLQELTAKYVEHDSLCFVMVQQAPAPVARECNEMSMPLCVINNACHSTDTRWIN